jgi:hypothetical protein
VITLLVDEDVIAARDRMRAGARGQAMTREELNALLAQSLFACRDAARTLCGEAYGRQVQGWKDLIREEWTPPEPIMATVLRLCSGSHDAVAEIWLQAAAIDVIEEDAGRSRESEPRRAKRSRRPT